MKGEGCGAVVVDLGGFGFEEDEDAPEGDMDVEVDRVCLLSLCNLAKASSSMRRASSLPTTPFGWGTSSLNPLPLDIWAIMSSGRTHEYDSY